MIAKVRWSAVMVVCGVVLFAGCGPKGRGLPTAKVTGTVSYKASPIPDGKIVFQHSSGEMTAIPFAADGKYELDVPVGKNLVMIQSMTSSEGAAGKGSGKTMEIFTSRIPERYANFDSSKLEVDVPASGTKYDVEITK